VPLLQNLKKQSVNMGSHWMLLTVPCAIALTKWHNIYHISSL
jgi:hypothetical protein